MHYGLNRLKKSKMSKIGLKSGEIIKIGWNRAKSRFQDRFWQNEALKQNPVSWTAVRCLLDYSCTVTDYYPSFYTQKRKKEKDRKRLAEKELNEFTEIRGFEDRKFKIRVEPSNTDRLSGKSGLTVSGACFVKKWALPLSTELSNKASIS